MTAARRLVVGSALIGLVSLWGGCFAAEDLIFPVWPANYFDEPPTEVGPYTVDEYRVDVPEGADGQASGITVFKPTNAEGARPAFVWVLGSNVQAYYHQSLHETLASWGFVVIVPDARPLTFTDFQYHRRNVDLAKQAIDLGVGGELDAVIDANRIAAGGYSIGGTMALFVAAEDSRVAGVALWAPTSSPFWTGVDPETLYPQVTVPVYFLLAEKDHVEPPSGFPATLKQKLVNATISEYIIPDGLHLYFQQPTGADSVTDPLSSLTRFEQQGIAIERTREWLGTLLSVSSE